MTAESQEHSVWSPSSAHRWRRCPGSINAERGLPDRVGREAAEGTVFHDHAELALRFGLEPENFKTGMMATVSGHSVCYNDEMIEHMRGGLDFIYDILDRHPDAILLVEQKVDISPWTGEKGGKGTSDVCIIIPSIRKIIVFDWKYGMVPVSPVENDQATLYGLGCWHSFAAKYFDNDPTGVDVDLIIWQPRIPSGGGTWPTTMDWLLEEGEKIKEQAAANREPDAPRIAGTKQCAYCKAASTCSQLAAYNLEQYSLRFDDIDDSLDYGIELPEPNFEEWTPERRSYVLLHWATFKRWHDRLKDAAMRDYVEGKPVPFMKLIEGRGAHRHYRESEQQTVNRLLEMHLEEKAYEKKPVTPAVAQKLLGKKVYDQVLKEYVVVPRGKPILVPETDPRPAYKTIGERLDDLFLDDTEDDEQ